MLYVDTSALLKRYIRETDSEDCERILLADPLWLTARHTSIEVQRNLARLLKGRALDASLAAFSRDWDRSHIIELDAMTCQRASEVALLTGARTLDSLHLGAALRLGATISFLTYDQRQALAARQLGFMVLGA